MLVIDTRIKLLLFILINFMVFGLKDFILGSVCFAFICVLSCLMGQKKIVLKYIIFYLVIAVIQQFCVYLPQVQIAAYYGRFCGAKRPRCEAERPGFLLI